MPAQRTAPDGRARVDHRAIAALAGRGAKEDVRLARSDLKVGGSRRQVVLRGPLGRRGKKAIMVLKPSSKADQELLARPRSLRGLPG